MVKTIDSDSDHKIDMEAAREVVFTRIFDAPRELLFKAWTDPEHLKRWFAHDGCTIHFSMIDIRPGGVYHS